MAAGLADDEEWFKPFTPTYLGLANHESRSIWVLATVHLVAPINAALRRPFTPDETASPRSKPLYSICRAFSVYGRVAKMLRPSGASNPQLNRENSGMHFARMLSGILFNMLQEDGDSRRSLLDTVSYETLCCSPPEREECYRCSSPMEPETAFSEFPSLPVGVLRASLCLLPIKGIEEVDFIPHSLPPGTVQRSFFSLLHHTFTFTLALCPPNLHSLSIH
ncbi:hypothetical protein BDV98DRAFT_83805 [Pterulicium gracile]|uniref:Uncharacterized protein n=1 Tax=Pterulicium gracile TaxID=1884261 RepID=A0A5C3QI61_9AGAR|nr:hypothetical protein BDV98DRAFT_83805 [Pterula gracilis]